LRLFPFPKFLLRLGDKQKMHPGVLRAAKFGAETEIRPGLIGLNPDMIRMARHRRNFPG
jgi:hypothetical protein